MQCARELSSIQETSSKSSPISIVLCPSTCLTTIHTSQLEFQQSHCKKTFTTLQRHTSSKTLIRRRASTHRSSEEDTKATYRPHRPIQLVHSSSNNPNKQVHDNSSRSNTTDDCCDSVPVKVTFEQTQGHTTGLFSAIEDSPIQHGSAIA